MAQNLVEPDKYQNIGNFQTVVFLFGHFTNVFVIDISYFSNLYVAKITTLFKVIRRTEIVVLEFFHFRN